MMEFRLMDLLHHFCQHWSYKQMNTWYHVKQGRVVWTRSDYILGTYLRHFKIVEIRGIRNYPSDQLILQARLIICPTEVGKHCESGGLWSQMGTGHGGSEETGR